MEMVLSKPFFSRFKSIIKDSRDQDPGGRYFSILLEQVYNENQIVMSKALFPNVRQSIFRNSLARTEYLYASNRIADVAIFNTQNSLVALIEVKEKDQNGPGVEKQARDYVKFCAKKAIHFKYITKRSPSIECSKFFRAAGVNEMYYGELYKNLSQAAYSNPLVKLFCDYLKEERVAYQPLLSDDLKSIKLLIMNSNNMSKRGHGKMKVASTVGAAANILNQLVNNVEVLGSSLHMRHKDCFGQKLVPIFIFWPEFDLGKTIKHLKEELSSNNIDSRLVSFGNLAVYAEGRIRQVQKSDKICYIWIGLYFSLDRKSSLEAHYMAGVGTYSHFHEGYSFIPEGVIEESFASKALTKLLLKEIKKATTDKQYSGHAGLKQFAAQLAK